jgi:DNA polymerase-3 subunit beta
MKLTVTQENLSKALGVVGRVASGKTPLPILNNILLRTDSNRLLLAATNLEIAITHHIGAKVATEGSITVPARLMTEFITNLPKGNVDLQVEGTKLHIISGMYNSTIHGIAPDEFPELPAIESNVEYQLDSTVLKRAIQQTVLVASKDDTRPVLTGVYCHTNGGALYFAATDGYRLAERELIHVDGDISAIIPATTLQDVLRVITDDVASVTMLIDENQVKFLIGEVEITSRLIDGKFPDYRQLIPQSSEIHADLPKDEFVRITKIASLFARDTGGSVTLKTEAPSKQLSIHSVASQLGENTSIIETNVDGDGQVTLNSRYLLEALGCIDDASISFAFSGKLAPCVLRSTEEKPVYTHIIMPLKS